MNTNSAVRRTSSAGHRIPSLASRSAGAIGNAREAAPTGSAEDLDLFHRCATCGASESACEAKAINSGRPCCPGCDHDGAVGQGVDVAPASALLPSLRPRRAPTPHRTAASGPATAPGSALAELRGDVPGRTPSIGRYQVPGMCREWPKVPPYRRRHRHGAWGKWIEELPPKGGETAE
jgi:hypothetical protein